MTTIKLNNYYPHLTECITLEVSEEIAVTLSIGGRLCDSYKRRKREHDECSLDGTPGFESDVTRPPLTPEEIMEQTEERDNLYNRSRPASACPGTPGVCSLHLGQKQERYCQS